MDRLALVDRVVGPQLGPGAMVEVLSRHNCKVDTPVGRSENLGFLILRKKDFYFFF